MIFKGNAARDGPHPVDPMWLTSVAMYALSDDLMLVRINASVAAGFPFAAVSQSGIDACLGIF